MLGEGGAEPLHHDELHRALSGEDHVEGDRVLWDEGGAEPPHHGESLRVQWVAVAWVGSVKWLVLVVWELIERLPPPLGLPVQES